MIDVFGLPNTNEFNRQIFYPLRGATVNDDYQVWVKPKSCTFVSILVLGAGGGGAGGTTGTAVTNPGGGGGASGNVASILVPASLIPDELYVNVGIGGTAGASGAGSGGAGRASYILFTKSPTIVTTNTLLIASGGNGGTSGTGGTVAANAASTSAFLSYLGYPTFSQGQAGANTALNVTVLLPVSGGAGGGSTTSVGPVSVAGGSVLGYAIGGAIGQNRGTNGYINLTSNDSSIEYPMRFTGAGGGGGNFAGTGGIGGDGGFGSGGGGGGAGTTGGTGGRGGDGLVIFTAF